MKRTIYFQMFALLCAVMLLLPGCQIEEEAPGITESLEWEVPQLNYGILEYEKLEMLPWYSGRTEATSFYSMAETGNGYYKIDYQNLFYADKANLASWVPVCDNPSCGHSTERCSSFIAYQHFAIRDGRIYITQKASGLPDHYQGDMAVILMSMDMDGNNRQLAYAFERQDPSSTPRAMMGDISPLGFLYAENVLNTDGTYTRYLYRVNEDGIATVRNDDFGENYDPTCAQIDFGHEYHLYGDRILILGAVFALDNIDVEYYRMVGNSLEPFELGLASIDRKTIKGAYLSGNTIRIYRQNDGYYDINIQTGEEVKVANAQLLDAGVDIVLPNCIVECTMSWTNFDGKGVSPAEGEHRFVLFDGECWRNVELPNELRAADAAQRMSVIAVTSDKIILTSFNIFKRAEGNSYYIIDLSKEELKMEYVYDQ